MVERKEIGKSVQEISNETNIFSKHLYKLEAKYKAGQSLEDEPRSGGSKKTTPQIESRIVRSIMSQPFQGSKQIKSEVKMGLDPKSRISDRSMRRVAHNKGLHSRMPALKKPLTPQTKPQSLKFAQEYLKKDMRYWNHVIFSDETIVELYLMTAG